MGSANPKLIDHRARDLALVHTVAKNSRLGAFALASQADIFAHGHFEDHSLLFPVFRHQRNAGANGIDGTV